ncbi:unnamed protein product [Withania somnifera]
MGDVADKIAYFQAITGVKDADLCTEILTGQDLELAISTFTSSNSPQNHHSSTATTSNTSPAATNQQPEETGLAGGSGGPPGIAWKIITLPVSIMSGGLGLISGAEGFGVWAAGGVLSYSLRMIGIGVYSGRNGESSSPFVSFVESFERDFRNIRPNFIAEGFMDALQRSRHEFKLLFVYLHSPEHPETPVFCERTLCNEALVAFINENFVAWGGSIRACEWRFAYGIWCDKIVPPRLKGKFCAVRPSYVVWGECWRVKKSHIQKIKVVEMRVCNGCAHLLGAIVEGPKSPEELLTALQRVLEESAPLLVSARLEAEEKRNNILLKEEQDAAYHAALEADQRASEERREQERKERVADEAERKRKEEKAAHERAAREAAEREAALAKMREEKLQSLGPEPEKGPDVTQVLVRFPTGERKERRFQYSTTIQSMYDYVDSLGCLEVEKYSLVSNFPWTVYGSEKLALSLKDAGLHPQASLFVELNL